MATAAHPLFSRLCGLILMLVAWASCSSISAQTYSVAQAGTVSDCGFYFTDSGFQLDDGGANEDHTVTFCPDTPGDDLTFYFLNFDLTAGDELEVWYGDMAAGAPDATYNATSLTGQNLYNLSQANPTGCMTFRFTSGTAGGSNWFAFAQCAPPCQIPLAAVTVNGATGPVLEVCPNEVLALDASPTTYFNGASGANWTWDFGDGSGGPLGPTPIKSYADGGVYNVTLTVEDDNGCSSLNSIDIQIRVAAPITLDVPALNTIICEGSQVTLSATAVTDSVTSPPTGDFGGGISLPDTPGQEFISSITFSGYPTGQVVSSPDDIESLLVNLEHSFLGDLSMTLTCPSGNSMTVLNGTGGGVWLGEPVDNNATPDAEGEGYNYLWAPTGGTGTMTDLFPVPANLNVSIPEGTYDVEGDWNNLVGCPVNGTWELTFTDGISGDNGFLFLWALTFSEDFTPEPISFEATVGAGCDSSFWAPAGAYGIPEVDVLGNCNSLSIAPPDAGTYDYTYIATDAFGCMADTTLTVTVVEGPEFLVTATATDACNAALPVVLSATPIGAVSPSPFANYTWQSGGTTIGATNPAFDFAPVIGANNYSLIFTDQAVAPATGNCVFTWDGTVTLSEAPTASMLPPVGCTTTGLALESNSTSPTGAALTHTWSIVDAGGTEVATGSGQAVTINGLPDGDYSVVLTVSDGSCSATVTETATVHPAPVASFSLSPTCLNEDVPVTLGVPFGPGVDAVWDFNGTTVATGQVTALPGVSINPGTATVGLTLSEDFGGVTCPSAPAAQTVEIYNLPLPQWDAPTALCVGSTPDISSAGSSLPGTYTADWEVTLGGVSQATGVGEVFTWPAGLADGTYGLSLNITDVNGCQDDIAAAVEVLATPSGTVTLSPACEGAPIDVAFTAPPGAAATWTWNGAELTGVGATLPAAVSATAGPQDIGFTLTLDYPGPGISCTSPEAVQTVEVAALPEAGFALDDACVDAPLTFTLDNGLDYTSPDATATWTWTDNGSALADAGGDFGTGPTAAPGAVNVSLVLALDYPGLGVTCTATAQDDAVISPLPVPAHVGDLEVCSDEDFSLSDASTVDAPSVVSSVVWTVEGAGYGPVDFGDPLNFPNPTLSSYTFTQTVTTDAGCMAEAVLNGTVNPLPDATFNLPVSVCQGAPVAVDLVGTPGDLGDWTLDGAPLAVVGAVFPAALTAVPGTFTVSRTLVGPGFCLSTESLDITVNPLPLADFAGPAQVCAGTPVQWTDNSIDPDGGAVTVQWEVDLGSGPQLSAGSIFDFGTLAQGTYPVVLTASTSVGCEAALTTDLMVNPIPDATFSLPATLCQGDVVPEPATASGGAFIEWTLNGNPLPVLGGNLGPDLTSAFGVQTVGVTVTSGAGVDQCSDTHEETVTVEALPVVAFSGVTGACEGQAVVWNDASSHPQSLPLDLDWSVDDGTTVTAQAGATLDLGIPSTGAYSIGLTVTSPAGCTADDAGALTVHPQPVAAFALTDVCAGSPVPWTAADPVAFGYGTATWSIGGTNVAPSATALPPVWSAAAGTVTVDVTVSETYATGATCSASDTQQANVWPNPTASWDVAAGYCDVAPVDFTSTNAISSASVLTTTWTVDDGSGATAVTVADDLPGALSGVGSYTVAMEVVSAEGCTADLTTTVEVHPQPVADFSLTDVCAGTPVPWTAADPVAFGYGTATWSIGGTNIAPSATALPPVWSAAAGAVTVEVTVSEAYATGATCSASDAQQANVWPNPTPSWDVEAGYCEDVAVDFTSANAISSASVLTTTWTVDDGTGAPLVSVTDDLPGALPGPGSYTVAMEVVSAEGCSADLTAPVEVHALPDAGFVLDEVCEGTPLSVVLDDPASVLASAATWTLSPATVITVTGGQVEASVSALPGQPEITLSLTESHATGSQCSASETVTTTVHGIPVADFSGPVDLCEGESGTFVNQSVLSTGAALQYDWSATGPTITVTATDLDFLLAVPEVGVHTINLVATGPGGCASGASSTLTVADGPDAAFALPAEACAGDVVAVNLTGGGPGGTPTWQLNGQPFNVTGPDFPAELTATPGVQVVTLDLDLNAGTTNCASVSTQSILVHAIPDAAWDVQPELCESTPLQWNSTSTVSTGVPLDVDWLVTDPSGTVAGYAGSALDLGVVLPGVFGVEMTVTGSGNCAAVPLSATVEVHDTPEAAFTLTDVCEGQPILWAASNPAEFNGTQDWTWNGGGIAATGGELEAAVSDQFGLQDVTLELTLVAPSGWACSNVATATAEVFGQPVASWSVVDEACEGTPVAFSSSNTVSSGASLTTTWGIDDGSGVVTTVNDALDLGIPSIGTYAVTMTVEGPGGCTDDLATTLEVHDTPEATFTLTDVCEGQPILWAASNPAEFNGTQDWTWNGGGIATTGGELEAAVSNQFGLQDVTLELTLVAPSGWACSDVATATAEVFGQPVASWSVVDEACEGTPVAFSSSNTVSSGASLATTWGIDDGSGVVTTVNDALDLGIPSIGSYAVTMTVEGPGGCTDDLATTLEVYDTPEADFTLQEACEGTAIAWAPVDPGQFSLGPAVWTWDGAPGASIVPAATTLPLSVSATWGSPTVTAEVTATAASGFACVDTHSELVTVHAVPAVGSDVMPEYCEGGVPAFNSTTSLASGEPFSTTWTVDAGGGPVATAGPVLDLNPAAPGTYSVTLDAEGPGNCAAQEVLSVLVVDAPEADFTLQEVCEGNAVPWSADVPGQFLGLPSWSWNGGGIAVGPAELDPAVSAAFGQQTVDVLLEVTAPLGLVCADTHSEAVVVHANPVADWNWVPEWCEGENVAFASSSSIASGVPLTEEWTWGVAGTTNTLAGPDLDLGIPATGQLTVQLTVEGAGGCSDVLAHNVEVHPTPDATFSADDVCVGEAILVTPVNAADFAAATVAWSANSNPTSVTAGALDGAVSSAHGIQDIAASLVLTFPSGFTCSDVHQEAVEVFANPVAAWDVVPGLCEGEPADFTSSNAIVTGDALSVEWTVDDGAGVVVQPGESLMLGVLPIGVVQVDMLVTAPGGCTAALSSTVEVHPVPVADFSASDVCAGTLVPWSAANPAGQFGTAAWTWNAAPILVTGPNLPADVSLVHGIQDVALTLTETYPTGAVCSDLAQVAVEVFATPVADWTLPGGWCEGEVAEFEATSTVATGAALDHTWTFTDAVGTQVFTGAELDLGVLAPGTYSFSLMSEAPGGCADDQAATVEVHANPMADFSLQEVCAGSPIPFSFNVPPGSAVPSWTWNGSGLTVAGNQLPPAVSDVPGIQQIGLTLVEAHATGATCSDNSIVPVEVFAVPTAELGSDSLWCAGETVLLQGAATGTGDLTFVWTSTFGTEGGPSWQVPNGLTGTFPVVLEVESEGGCSDAISFDLRIDPVPEVALSDTFLTDCAPFIASLDAQIGAYNGVLYSTVWSWEGQDSTAVAWSEVVPAESWTVTCTVTAGDADLTCTGSASALVVGVETPVADFIMAPENPTTRDREVDLVSLSEGPISSYTWTVDGEEVGQVPDIEYAFPPYFGGTYTVCLGVESAFGCGDTTCQVVEVVGGVQVYVPSAFTPDNDGVNDAFLPSIHPLDQVEDYQLQIFNRWGELVFVTQDPEQPWLGGYPGGTHYVGNEVFTYVLILDTDLDPPFRKTGSVTVIR